MAQHNTLEVCRTHLFDDKPKLLELGLPDKIVERIIRLRSAYTLWLEYPRKKDAEIRDHLMKFGVNKSAAYDDIAVLKLLLGDMTETSKAFHRFKFNSMIQAAYDLAEKKRNEKNMVAAADKYAKYNKLDKEDAFKIPWEELIPQPFEPTSDPTVIGIKPIPNIQEKIRKMKEKYFTEAEGEYISYEEVDFNEDDLFAPEITPTNG
jgi:hypothetical protein